MTTKSSTPFRATTKYKRKEYAKFIGLKFNELTILDFPGEVTRPDYPKSTTPAVTVRCSCGKEYTTRWLTIYSGRTKSCGHIHGKYKEDKTEASCRDLLCRYRHSAKVRHYAFELNYDEFREITSKNCHYCGLEPSQSRNCKNCQAPYAHNGIDRKDSSLGYTVENCVPCCVICNRAKMTMGIEDFIKYLDRVAKFRLSQIIG